MQICPVVPPKMHFITFFSSVPVFIQHSLCAFGCYVSKSRTVSPALFVFSDTDFFEKSRWLSCIGLLKLSTYESLEDLVKVQIMTQLSRGWPEILYFIQALRRCDSGLHFA